VYHQLNSPKNSHMMHWHAQNCLDEFEALLDSEYLGYLDPELVNNMKHIIQTRRGEHALHDRDIQEY